MMVFLVMKIYILTRLTGEDPYQTAAVTSNKCLKNISIIYDDNSNQKHRWFRDSFHIVHTLHFMCTATTFVLHLKNVNFHMKRVYNVTVMLC